MWAWKLQTRSCAGHERRDEVGCSCGLMQGQLIDVEPSAPVHTRGRRGLETPQDGLDGKPKYQTEWRCHHDIRTSNKHMNHWIVLPRSYLGWTALR